MTPKVHGAMISKSPYLSAAKKPPLLELFLISVVATPLPGVLMVSEHGSSDGAPATAGRLCRGYIARFPSEILASFGVFGGWLCNQLRRQM
jgi:hypothetical protein